MNWGARFSHSSASVSLSVSYSDESHSFVVFFQMFDPFFTIFSAGDGDYNFNIDLQELSRLILADDDLFLTILVPSAFWSANLISSTSTFCFRRILGLFFSFCGKKALNLKAFGLGSQFEISVFDCSNLILGDGKFRSLASLDDASPKQGSEQIWSQIVRGNWCSKLQREQ